MNPVLLYEFGKSRKKFVSSWNTVNTSAGSSTSTQVKLPLISTGTYAMRVDWGDGNSDNITVWNAAATTHTYSSSGTYTIKITGRCDGWSFNNTGDRLKILNVTEWGILKLTSLTSAHFQGCANLTLTTVIDALDLSLTNTLGNSFRGCTALTSINKLNEWNTVTLTSTAQTFFQCTNFTGAGIGSWNMVNVTSISQMFLSCSAFNQNVGAWNLSNCTNISGAFNACSIFNNGGSNTINNWDVSKVTNMGSVFAQATPFNQPLNLWNTALVTDMSLMFQACTSFNQNLGSWNTSKVTSMIGMFRSCTVFNNGGSDSIKNWDVTKVITFGQTGTPINGMFSTCPAFNQPLNWNPLLATNFSGMFFGPCGFNQDISAWDVSSGLIFESMFSNTTFNNGLGAGVSGTMSWNTGNATSMLSMFNGNNKFNQNISSWNVSKVLNFSNMFLGATTFNQNIGSWTLSSTGSINMTGMFSSATIFNQNLGSWVMTRVTNTSNMFFNALAFNNGGSTTIDSWDMSGVTSMVAMFQSTTVFNQPIGSWNTGACINMGQMFAFAGAFNQNIGGWNTINVTNMNTMFQNCNSFNQNIGAWDVRNVTAFSNFMAGKTPATFSTTNLDAIYNGWSALPSVKPSIVITFGTAKYTAGASAGRAILTGAPNNWAITDGGI